MNDQPTVFVVDDDVALTQSLRFLLESEGLQVATFGSAHEFLERFAPEQTGCLILDVRMPGMSGLELQRELQRRGATLPVIVVSGHGDVPMAVEAVKDGAFDFIEKPLDDRVLMARVQEAIALDQAQLRNREERRLLAERAEALTKRERQVFERAAAGDPNKRIAADLTLSEKTIEVHRANLMRKLEVHSIAELVRAWVMLGGPKAPDADA